MKNRPCLFGPGGFFRVGREEMKRDRYSSRGSMAMISKAVYWIILKGTVTDAERSRGENAGVKT